VGIERFDRVPLLFAGRARAIDLDRLSEHLGRRPWKIWAASGRTCNFGPGVRRQQGRASSSIWPPRRSRRDATRSSRSAACSRTTRARSRPSPPTRASVASSCRSAGSSGPTPSTTRSATSCSRGSWAPTCASIRPGSTSDSQELGGGARVGRGERRQAVRDSRRRLRPPARRARVRPLGRRGGRAGDASSASSSTRSSSAR
jgi:hypothetical protein